MSDVREEYGIREVLDLVEETVGAGGTFQPSEFRGETRVVIDRDSLVEVCKTLKETEPFYFIHLSDITAVDYPDREKRFDVIYQLYSFKLNLRLRLRLNIAEDESVPSLTGLWETANWLERECYDMFGIEFEEHPNLERILMPKATRSHPLRKDFPLQPREDFQQRRPKVEQESEEWDEEYGPHPR